MTIPIYLVLYLATSPTVSASKGNVIANSHELVSLPFSLLAGFIVPAIMLSLPAPSVQSFESKQIWLAIWQAFPIWVSAFQQIFKRCIVSIAPEMARKTTIDERRTIRTIYVILILFAGFTQAAIGALTATSLLFPGLFAPEYVGIFNPSRAFIPATVTASTKMSDIGSGALLFLQYDEAIGSVAVLMWTLFMFVKVYGVKQQLHQWIKLALGVTLLISLTGPMGCSLALMWGRDEVLFEGNDQ